MSSLRLVLVSTLLMLTVACGGYSSPPAAPSPTPAAGGTSSPVTIPRGAESLANRAYSPDDVNTAVGDRDLTNTDAVAHTSTSDAGAWNSGTAPGRSVLYFRTPGPSPSLHDSPGDGGHRRRALKAFARQARTLAVDVERNHLTAVRHGHRSHCRLAVWRWIFSTMFPPVALPTTGGRRRRR